MKRAFTLIELLVVIAIIGILSSVVLVSLNDSRDSARGASVLSSLKSIQTQAEIYNIDNGTYEGLCDDTEIAEMVSSLGSSSDGAACWVATDSYSDFRAELAPIDFGVGAAVDGTYYGTDPFGVFTFDSANTGTTMNWASAISTCQSAGKRLSGPSVLKAIYDIDSATPADFAADYYWLSLESPSSSSQAYQIALGGGGVNRGNKGGSNYVRCVR